MQLAFVCSRCQAVFRRLAGLPEMQGCPRCGGALEKLSDDWHPTRRQARMPCDKGEVCPRTIGKHCPGGRGC